MSPGAGDQQHSLRVTPVARLTHWRYRATNAARANGLTGWVDNLWDGRVEMEVQGELSQIEEMIQEIQSGSFIRIEKYQMEDLPVDEEEWSFYAR